MKDFFRKMLHFFEKDAFDRGAFDKVWDFFEEHTVAGWILAIVLALIALIIRFIFFKDSGGYAGP